MDLVVLASQRLDAEPFTTGDVIAEYAGIELASVNRTIRNIHERLEHFGKVGFKIKPMPSGQRAKVYLLNEQQATLLITFLKNTPRVADFKEALVREFTLMKRELYQRRAKFELGKEFSKGLQSAIADSPALDEHHHLYANINKLVYKQALGVNVGELRRSRDIPKSEPITSYLSTSEADAVRKVKTQITNLLEMKLNYQQIKAALQVQGIVYQIRLTLPTKSAATN